MDADTNFPDFTLFFGFHQCFETSAIKYAVIFRASNIVEKNQVKPVCLQAPQAPFQLLSNTGTITFIDFCGKIEFLAPCFQCKADFLFAVTITICSVHEVNSSIECSIQKNIAFFL